jgi:hypothetical protein
MAEVDKMRLRAGPLKPGQQAILIDTTQAARKN